MHPHCSSAAGWQGTSQDSGCPKQSPSISKSLPSTPRRELVTLPHTANLKGPGSAILPHACQVENQKYFVAVLITHTLLYLISQNCVICLSLNQPQAGSRVSAMEGSDLRRNGREVLTGFAPGFTPGHRECHWDIKPWGELLPVLNVSPCLWVCRASLQENLLRR